MALEICGPRLLAPAFGSATIVWSMVIGATMVALSIGGLLGGRLSERDPSGRWAWMLLAAGAIAAAVSAWVAPLLAPWLSGRFALTPFGQSAALALAVVLLFVPPGVLAAAVFPVCLRACTLAVERAGRVYATLYLASTLGSLAGVLLGPLALVGAVGTRASVVLCCVPALLSAAVASRRRFIFPVVLVVGAALALPALRLPSPTAWESSYASYEILAQGDTRLLSVDRGLCYSVLRPHLTVTGHCYDVYLAAPSLAQRHTPRRIALIGVAGGTLLHQFRRAWPNAQIEAVEIDPTLITAARTSFDLDATGVPVAALDGRCWLRGRQESYDFIAVDVMMTGTPPIHLMSREFFAEAAALLAPEGVMAVNTLPPLDGPIGAAMRQTLENTVVINSVAVGSRRPLSASGLASAFPWPGWAERAEEMRRDMRPAEDRAPLDDDAGALPWWWGLRVQP